MPELDTVPAPSLATADAAVPASTFPTRPTAAPDPLRPLDTFARRHLGSNAAEVAQMLDLVGYPTLDGLL